METLELNGTELGLGTQGSKDKYLGSSQLMGQLLDLLLLLSQELLDRGQRCLYLSHWGREHYIW